MSISDMAKFLLGDETVNEKDTASAAVCVMNIFLIIFDKIETEIALDEMESSGIYSISWLDS